MTNAQAATLGALLAIAALDALGVPAPRLIAFGCDNAPYTLGVKLARYEDEFSRCNTITALPWAI